MIQCNTIEHHTLCMSAWCLNETKFTNIIKNFKSIIFNELLQNKIIKYVKT